MSNEKIPHDIPKMFRKIRNTIHSFPRAALFELAEKGFGSPFEILVGCVLSIRTLDEVSLPAALRLLEKARTPRQLLNLTEAEIARLITPCTFAGQKASNLRKIAGIVETEHQGRLICEFESLVALPGIGPKCAGLILGIACDTPAISVDVHVHRVTNRWGYVQATTPEKSGPKRKTGFPTKESGFIKIFFKRRLLLRGTRLRVTNRASDVNAQRTQVSAFAAHFAFVDVFCLIVFSRVDRSSTRLVLSADADVAAGLDIAFDHVQILECIQVRTFHGNTDFTDDLFLVINFRSNADSVSQITTVANQHRNRSGLRNNANCSGR